MRTIIAIFVICILFCSCEKAESIAETKSDITDKPHVELKLTTDNVISEQEAIAIVKEKVDPNNERIIEVDGRKIINNIEYYYIHVYSLGSEAVDVDEKTGETVYASFTCGWYYVDVRNGTTYEENFGQADTYFPYINN